MKIRQLLKITSRSSSITNSFVQAIVPSKNPKEGEIEEALSILGMSAEDLTCAYCGRSATDSDHLRPLVKNKRPTGYINEIRNLVPACGPCNQSKSGSDWQLWMEKSPRPRSLEGIGERMARLKKFVEWGNVQPLNLESIANDAFWRNYWESLEAIHQTMRAAQFKAEELRADIQSKLESNC